ncbi:hypothetical protein MCEMRE26_01032 [Candidatus Nanopelagicaceae bacterium]
MEILKFDNAANPRRKKNNNLKSLAGLATVAAIAVLGSTLAANLSLNSGGAIEFGQGVSVTSACDSDGITVTPAVRFVNAAGAGTFYLSTIALSGVNAASTTTCLNKTFTLNAYNNSDATPLQLATSSSTAVTSATFSIKTGNTAVGSAGVTLSGVTSDSTSGAITLGFGEPSSTSGAVYKITLQSQ